MSTNPGLGGAAGRAKQRATEVLAEFSHGQRAVVGIAVLTAIVGGYLFMSWASKPTYTPLFTNLQSSDAAAITQKLTAEKVPYQLSDGGSSILVPQSDVYQQRLDMSAAGLPSTTGSGYTLLDKAGITTSDFQQQVLYQQAVQTELDNTIGAMSGVDQAVVHVVIPQQNLFGSTSDQPSASVLLELAPGTVLGTSQVQAIVHLVASSIENLNPSQVTVVDNKGNVLSAPGSNAAQIAAGGSEAQQTQQFDQSVNSQLEQYLAAVVGAGNVVVDTAATLDYNQTSTQSKTYSNKAIPVSSQTTSEKYTGAAAASAAGGALGATTTTGKGTSAPSTYTNTSNSSQGALSEVDKTVQAAPGTIQRLSVSVLLNSKAGNVNIATIKNLVATAVGLQTKRGDTIAVSSLPFAASASTTNLKATPAKSSSGMINEAVTGALLLLVIVLVVLALLKLRKPTRTPIELPAELSPPLPTLALEAQEPPTMAYRPPAALAAAAKEMGDVIDKDPAKVAELLRGWLAEDRV